MRIAQQAVDALVARVAGLFVAAERLRHFALVETVHPDHAGLNVPDESMSLVGILRPHAGRQSLYRVVGNRDGLVNIVERDHRCNVAEDFFTRDAHRMVDVREQRGIDL